MPYIHDRIDPNERFRERRHQIRRRRRQPRAALAVVVLGLVAGLVLGATFITRQGGSRPAAAADKVALLLALASLCARAPARLSVPRGLPVSRR